MKAINDINSIKCLIHFRGAQFQKKDRSEYNDLDRWLAKAYVN